MRYEVGTFDYEKIDRLATDIATWLSIPQVSRLPEGSVCSFGGRFGGRVNGRRELKRIVIGQLLVRSDGSGHGPPELAEKVIDLCRGGEGKVNSKG